MSRYIASGCIVLGFTILNVAMYRLVDFDGVLVLGGLELIIGGLIYEE